MPSAIPSALPPATRPRSALPAMLALLSMLAMLAGCAHRPVASHDATAWSQSRQMVLVSASGWDDTHATLRRYVRDADGGWQRVGEAIPVSLGRNGSAWGLGLHPAQADGPQKREGDGRAPAGVFTIGTAFGYVDRAATPLPYAAMGVDDYCIDVADSPLYNRIVNAGTVGRAAVEGSTETMRLDLHNSGDPRYRLGFVIEHNPQAIRGAGSCIFAHLRRSPDETTAGCTAMDNAELEALMAWLDPAQSPVFVLLPDTALKSLATSWHLPGDAASR